MEQSRKRSLTESEKAAEKTLIMLRALGLVPAQSYDFVTWDLIKHVMFEKDQNDYVNELRERNVMFEWKGGPKVALVLRQGRSYYLSAIAECFLLEDKMYGWVAESIEIIEEKYVWSLLEKRQKKTTGKIVFDNIMAVSMMERAAGLHYS